MCLKLFIQTVIKRRGYGELRPLVLKILRVDH